MSKDLLKIRCVTGILLGAWGQKAECNIGPMLKAVRVCWNEMNSVDFCIVKITLNDESVFMMRVYLHTEQTQRRQWSNSMY